MEKNMRLSFLFILIFMISSNVQALKWTSVFVVWEGSVYEVNEGEFIEESEIGKNIGEVKTKSKW